AGAGDVAETAPADTSPDPPPEPASIVEDEAPAEGAPVEAEGGPANEAEAPAGDEPAAAGMEAEGGDTADLADAALSMAGDIPAWVSGWTREFIASENTLEWIAFGLGVLVVFICAFLLYRRIRRWRRRRKAARRVRKVIGHA
ncbi:MAG: hypothetical protein ACLFQ5_09880, partial [Oceanicaulis sp.]